MARLERGLLVRAPVNRVDAARLFAPLRTPPPSTLAADYQATLATIHNQTVLPGGQWDRSHTYGSQLWPDVQYDEWNFDHPTPYENTVWMNYWQPVHAEVMELLRTGQPRFFWDFTLPQTWLQIYSAYLNLGDRTHGILNGVAVNSGGSGEGHWHRSNWGSDDYTYALGFDVVYALRPTQPLLDRMARTGQNLVDRYSIPWAEQERRDPWVNSVDVKRGTVQHYALLANCAEFVPGPQGVACHNRLLEILTELAADNLKAGLFCTGDVPSETTCNTPQQFMTNALFYPFFHRMLLAYGDRAGGLRRALVDGPRHYYNYGIDKLADGVSIDPDGVFAAGLTCTLGDGGASVMTCERASDGDGNVGVFGPVKPHTLVPLLLAHDLDPSVGLCTVARNGLDALDSAGLWHEWIDQGAGWWKGSAMMMQQMAVGVGTYTVCKP